MKNKKGFTLIELLVVLVLMLSITAIAILAYGRLNKVGKDDQYSSIEEQIKTAAEQYLTKNSYIINDEENITIYIPLKTLVDDDLLGVLIDPRDKTKLADCSIVEVSKNNGDYIINYNRNVNNETCNVKYVKYKTVSNDQNIPDNTAALEFNNFTAFSSVNNAIGEEIKITGSNWYNKDESFSGKVSDYDVNTSTNKPEDIHMWYCMNFKTGTNEEGKEYDKVPSNASYALDGLSSTKNIVDVDNNRICNLYTKDFNISIRTVSTTNLSLTSSQVEIGKDTISPEISTDKYDVTNGIKKGSIVNTLIQTKTFKNTLIYNADLSDNLGLNKNSFKTDLVGWNGTLNLSDGDKKAKVSKTVDVQDYLIKDIDSTFGYVYPFELNIEDKAGNKANLGNLFNGYFPCDKDNGSVIEKLGIAKQGIKLKGLCHGTKRLVYVDKSDYDKTLFDRSMLTIVNKLRLTSVSKKISIDDLGGYVICNSDKSLEFKDDPVCIIWKGIKESFACAIQRQDCNGNALCELGKALIGWLCPDPAIPSASSNPRTVGVAKAGSTSITINVSDARNTSKSLFVNTYDSSSTVNLNQKLSEIWINGRNHPNGLVVSVDIGGSFDSYVWSLPDAGNGEVASDTNMKTSAKYNLKKDGKGRTAKITADDVTVTLNFDMDLNGPEILITSRTKGKSCGGSPGVSTSWKIHDTTSGAAIAKYYYGNATEFDDELDAKGKIPSRTSKGADITYTDNWSRNCTQNNIPSSSQCYYQKIKASDIAGNISYYHNGMGNCANIK